MTSSEDWEMPLIAAAIQRDATLSADVLRLANSAFYNTSGQRIVQMERAVVQIGQKRIGELALATSTLTALTSGIMPWMNVGLAWKRSMAAGLAVEMIVDEGQHQRIDQGLLLSAIMHPLGRVVLGALYPKQYELMVENCRHNDGSLLDHERKVFPMTHAEAIAYFLEIWGIPAEIYGPLKHVLADRAELDHLPDPTRTKAELLTLAIFLGNLAIGQWESWDVVDLPPAARLPHVGIHRFAQIIAETRQDVEQLASFAPVARKRPGSPRSRNHRASWPIATCRTRRAISWARFYRRWE